MAQITLNGKVITITNKTKILDLIENNNKQFIVAKVNKRLRELSYELAFDSEVELLDLTNYDGVKVYEATFRYMLALAFFNVYPDYKIRISYGISRSLLVSIIEPDNVSISNEIIKNITKELNRLVNEDITFEKVLMAKDQAYDFYKKTNQQEKYDLLKYRKEKMCHFFKCGDYLNYAFGYMAPSTGYINKFNLFIYDDNMVVQYPRYETKGEIPEFIDEPVLSKTLKKAYKWSKICNGELVSKMNDQINDNNYIDFINLNETLHNDMLHELGQKIADEIDNIRLICIAGPSSSGKTTFSNRLRIELMSRGINPLRISLDMYYKEKKDCPIDEDGKSDYESLDALDIELFNENMIDLINGEEVTLPIFNFKSGREKEGIKAKIDKNTPIIIEGIHALNDKLSYSISKHLKYKIYISPQFQINLDNHNPISYTDIRLLRRIVRDKNYRGTSAEGTLAMWESVRRGEFKWIYPYQEGCNFVYNSALMYELCVLKKYALPSLQEISIDSPYYIQANRLIKFLKYFKDMDDKFVPCNSLLREFIGGSCFAEVNE